MHVSLMPAVSFYFRDFLFPLRLISEKLEVMSTQASIKISLFQAVRIMELFSGTFVAILESKENKRHFNDHLSFHFLYFHALGCKNHAD